MSDVMLSARGVEKSYTAAGQRLHILRGLDLEVRRGEMVAIMGASGVGKSTLLHVLGGLDRPDSGAVAVDGFELASADDAALVAFRNKHVGFVFQFHHLLPEFTALENVEMPLRIARVPAREARPVAEQLLSRVGLAERLGHRPGMLSGGEQQRVAVARALVNEPAILLADEPTGNLDSVNSRMILDLFQGLNARLRQTIVMITHNPEAAAVAHRTIEMRDGLVVSHGHLARREA